MTLCSAPLKCEQALEVGGGANLFGESFTVSGQRLWAKYLYPPPTNNVELL